MISISHRLRDMQTLPFVVVANPHLSRTYELYYEAFETLRRVREIKSLESNDQFCKIVKQTLHEHLTVIPSLAMGFLECQNLMHPDAIDKFMNILLRSRISRRVIAEQHLALTDTFNSPWHFPDAQDPDDATADYVGEVFLRCNAKEVVQSCWDRVTSLAKEAYGSSCKLPELYLNGHVDSTFPYIPSHLQYIVGELLRNSIQAVVETRAAKGIPPPIEVLVCEAPQHVILRISDQGGGIHRDTIPGLWSFGKGSRSKARLNSLSQVPRMAATMEELKSPTRTALNSDSEKRKTQDGSLSSLTSRPPNLRLGMGLPMSRVYAEYWAGSLELHNLEGYGVDAFLQISKLGSKNEQLSTRAIMDAV